MKISISHTFLPINLMVLSCSALFLSACNLNITDMPGNELEKNNRLIKEEKLSSKQALSKQKNNAIILRQQLITGNTVADQVMLEQSSQIPPQALVKRSISSTTYYPSPMIIPVQAINRENYLEFDENSVNLVVEKPVSTLSIDVDTASYSNIRRLLMQGKLPPKDTVKTEELLNYFNYQYPSPADIQQPFTISTEIAPSPWNKHKKLLQIGIKGYEINKKDLPAANLVFLVDVSGSMHTANKLGLVKSSLKLLLKQLDANDKVSLVVYAGAAGVVLGPTAANEKIKIERAIDNLTAGGSTNGEAGIIEAYAMAQKGFIKDGINRVIIASDGDMNVGRFKLNQLKELITSKRESGIALTTLGFGMGNYNYALMEQLADVGNGNAAYIDNLLEAQKVLVNEMSSTLLTIAKDVKIQIEFSPLVKEYRLIGYENRMLKREDFNNDKVDAGDIGAGHTVTAIYEISLVNDQTLIDPLRYYSNTQQSTTQQLTTDGQYSVLNGDHNKELAFLKIRFKQPDQSRSQLISKVISKDDVISELDKSSDNFKFAASVVAFGQLLKGGKYLEDFTYTDIISLAQQSKGLDQYGYRAEFIKLVRLAKGL